MEVQCVVDAKATVGKSPVWSVEEEVLYWVAHSSEGDRLFQAKTTTDSS